MQGRRAVSIEGTAPRRPVRHRCAVIGSDREQYAGSTLPAYCPRSRAHCVLGGITYPLFKSGATVVLLALLAVIYGSVLVGRANWLERLDRSIRRSRATQRVLLVVGAVVVACGGVEYLASSWYGLICRGLLAHDDPATRRYRGLAQRSHHGRRVPRAGPGTLVATSRRATLQRAATVVSPGRLRRGTRVRNLTSQGCTNTARVYARTTRRPCTGIASPPTTATPGHRRA